MIARWLNDWAVLQKNHRKLKWVAGMLDQTENKAFRASQGWCFGVLRLQ